MCDRDGCDCTMKIHATISDLLRIEMESNPPQYQSRQIKTPNTQPIKE